MTDLVFILSSFYLCSLYCLLYFLILCNGYLLYNSEVIVSTHTVYISK